MSVYEIDRHDLAAERRQRHRVTGLVDQGEIRHHVSDGNAGGACDGAIISFN